MASNRLLKRTRCLSSGSTALTASSRAQPVEVGWRFDVSFAPCLQSFADHDGTVDISAGHPIGR
jgi:hypothetical protein